MSTAQAYQRLRALRLPVIRTSEAAAVLNMSPLAAAQLLRRLAQAGLVRPLRHGQFWLPDSPIDPWVALDFVAEPYLAYCSLYSALYVHGTLSQIPQVHFAITLGPTRKVKTAVGVYSLHQMKPELFGGFETLRSGAKLATVEKAVFDLAYLAGTRSRLFARPPELELDSSFRRKELDRWVKRIVYLPRRQRVRAFLERLRIP